MASRDTTSSDATNASSLATSASSASEDVITLPSSPVPVDENYQAGNSDSYSDDSFSSVSGGQEEEDVSALHDFIAGGIAGSASVVVGQ